MPALRILFLIVALTATSGYRFRCYIFCTDQTGIQDDYVEQRDRCREYAQLKLDMAVRSMPPGAEEDKSHKALLVSLFSQCMGNNGWSVPDGSKEGSKPGAAAQAAQATGVPHAPLPGGPRQVAPAPAGAAPVNAVESATLGATGGAGVASPAGASARQGALSRGAECAFARQSASVSSIAAARAEACDLECAQRLAAAPDAPRPAACPSEERPDYATGHED